MRKKTSSSAKMSLLALTSTKKVKKLKSKAIFVLSTASSSWLLLSIN